MGSTAEEVAQQRDGEGGDMKESYEVGREGVDGEENQWPPVSRPSAEGGRDDDDDDEAQWAVDFRQTMIRFHDVCKEVHRLLMRGVAIGLGLDDPDFFDGFVHKGDNTLRLLHYPAVQPGGFEAGKRVRAGAHTDYGSVTLLFQDQRGGLQVEPPLTGEGAGGGGDRRWIDVEPIEGTVVVNAGDLLARWSNDLIRSTRHRVVEPPPPPPPPPPSTLDATGGSSAETKEGRVGEYPARYSVAYFCNPDFDAWIEALPGTWSSAAEDDEWDGKGRGKKYDAVMSGQYLEQRLSATY